jgi:eukaryotic-like serine/threonine-protein kinase
MEEARSPAKLPRASAPGPDPLIGRIVNDRYRIIGVIARGGMGKVYRAEQQPLGRLVALKVLTPNYTGDNNPEFHKRFFLEASIASKLTHPNTVTIFDYGKTDDDIYYIAMELLEGRTLHRLLREEAPLTAERTMHIARQICRSLREAHNHGVIHRDLKPANVFLLHHGDERDVVKVLDFGLVKNLEDTSEELTQAGLFMGSPKYMSPEQIRGERCDGRVDIYALGAMMFEMLTGKVPFDRQNSVNILMAHIHEEVPALRVANGSVRVPPELESVVRKCMAKSADARYASMEDLLTALKQASGVAQTMTGEYRAVDLADLSRSVELPLPPASVQLRGDFLSGGGKPSMTTLDHSVLGALSAFGTPANGQTLVGQTTSGHTLAANTLIDHTLPHGVLAAAAKNNRPVVFGALALVAALAIGGGLLFSGDPHGKSAQGSTAKAEQPSAPPSGTGASALATTAPTAQPAPAPTAPQTTLLVSLRSTPAGAMVWVNGKEYGPTPTQVEWTGEEAALGREVTFRFQRRGFRDLTVTRQVRSPQLEIDAPPMDPVVAETVTRPHGRRSSAAEPLAPKPSAEPSAPVTPLKGYKAEPY